MKHSPGEESRYERNERYVGTQSKMQILTTALCFKYLNNGTHKSIIVCSLTWLMLDIELVARVFIGNQSRVRIHYAFSSLLN